MLDVVKLNVPPFIRIRAAGPTQQTDEQIVDLVG